MEIRLFTSDNFSNPEIRYKSISKSPDAFKPVLDHYFDVYEIVSITQRDRSEINSENYKVVLNINNEQQVFLLRKFNGLTDHEQIRFFLGLLEKLRQSSVPVTEVITSLNDELTIEHDGAPYALFPFIEGVHFSPTIEGLRNIAKAVAGMHRALHQLSPGEVDRIQELSKRSKTYFNIIPRYTVQDFKSLSDRISYLSSSSEMDTRVLTYLPQYIETTEQIETHRKVIEALEKQVIHSDLHPHNVLMHKENVAAILDFDALRVSQRAREVAFAMYRFGRQFFVHGEDTSSMKDIVATFFDSYKSVYPLSDEERRLLPILLKDEFLTKILFVLKGVYEEGNNAWAGDLPKFLPAIEEINYFWPA